MAERSFTQEVSKLRLGDGQTFHGEGILAVTKALLQSGVSYVAGYQGAPISHLMDVLTDANDILTELGVHFEHSASEATAAATLAAALATFFVVPVLAQRRRYTRLADAVDPADAATGLAAAPLHDRSGVTP